MNWKLMPIKLHQKQLRANGEFAFLRNDEDRNFNEKTLP